jgi:hypothetical protein
MAWLGERWELRHGDELLGVITVEDQDFPWLTGRFEESPGFARWAPLFAESSALLDELSDSDDAAEWERWERLYDRISGALTLVAPNEPVTDFLLHIEDGQASFRWLSTAG